MSLKKKMNYFLMLLSCHNIKVKDILPDKKANLFRIKIKRQPLFNYKVLDLKLPKNNYKYNPSVNNQWQKRIHLCMGHFKTYTEQNPLFGKIVGKYFWNPHLRGNKKLGMIVKDYNIKTVRDHI